MIALVMTASVGGTVLAQPAHAAVAGAPITTTWFINNLATDLQVRYDSGSIHGWVTAPPSVIKAGETVKWSPNRSSDDVSIYLTRMDDPQVPEIQVRTDPDGAVFECVSTAEKCEPTLKPNGAARAVLYVLGPEVDAPPITVKASAEPALVGQPVELTATVGRPGDLFGPTTVDFEIPEGWATEDCRGVPVKNGSTATCTTTFTHSLLKPIEVVGRGSLRYQNDSEVTATVDVSSMVQATYVPSSTPSWGLNGPVVFDRPYYLEARTGIELAVSHDKKAMLVQGSDGALYVRRDAPAIGGDALTFELLIDPESGMPWEPEARGFAIDTNPVTKALQVVLDDGDTLVYGELPAKAGAQWRWEKITATDDHGREFEVVGKPTLTVDAAGIPYLAVIGPVPGGGLTGVWYTERDSQGWYAWQPVRDANGDIVLADDVAITASPTEPASFDLFWTLNSRLYTATNDRGNWGNRVTELWNVDGQGVLNYLSAGQITTTVDGKSQNVKLLSMGFMQPSGGSTYVMPIVDGKWQDAQKFDNQLYTTSYAVSATPDGLGIGINAWFS